MGKRRKPVLSDSDGDDDAELLAPRLKHSAKPPTGAGKKPKRGGGGAVAADDAAAGAAPYTVEGDTNPELSWDKEILLPRYRRRCVNPRVAGRAILHTAIIVLPVRILTNGYDT